MRTAVRPAALHGHSNHEAWHTHTNTHLSRAHAITRCSQGYMRCARAPLALSPVSHGTRHQERSWRKRQGASASRAPGSSPSERLSREGGRTFCNAFVTACSGAVARTHTHTHTHARTRDIERKGCGRSQARAPARKIHEAGCADVLHFPSSSQACSSSLKRLEYCTMPAGDRS